MTPEAPNAAPAVAAVVPAETAESGTRSGTGLAAGSEPDPWRRLCDRHGAYVRHAVRAAMRGRGQRLDPDRVDDHVQEVWCRLLERQRRALAGPRRDSDGQTASYLRRVAETVVTDAWRSENAVRRRPPGGTLLDALRQPIVDLRGCPERRLLAREALRACLRRWREALGAGASRGRFEVLRLAWLHGLGSDEIAARLGGGWTVTGIDSMLCRLRKRLAELGVPAPWR